MKIPRDLNAKKLIRLLKKYDYFIDRQVGSHIRLSRSVKGSEHQITIPNHNPIKIGTLNSILNDISEHLKLSKQDLVDKLFE
jgi:predicted RNA binding protein YcfA (HicA-like mRNA interferase family)